MVTCSFNHAKTLTFATNEINKCGLRPSVVCSQLHHALYIYTNLLQCGRRWETVRCRTDVIVTLIIYSICIIQITYYASISCHQYNISLSQHATIVDTASISMCSFICVNVMADISDG